MENKTILSRDEFTSDEIHLASLDQKGVDRFVREMIRMEIFVNFFVYLLFLVVVFIFHNILFNGWLVGNSIKVHSFYNIIIFGYMLAVPCGFFGFLYQCVSMVTNSRRLRLDYSPLKEYSGLCAEAVSIVSRSDLAKTYCKAVTSSGREICKQDLFYLRQIENREKNLSYCNMLHSMA